MKGISYIFIFIIVSGATLVKGQELEESSQDSLWSITSDLIVVRSGSSPLPIPKSTVSGISLDNLLEPNIRPALLAIPGITMESGALNTNRISIRGVGNREAFATSKIKMYFDEIPLTNGVGESSIEDIDPGILGNISVFKNPASAIWGAGLGGAIHLKSKYKYDKSWLIQMGAGSFGRFQSKIQFTENTFSEESPLFLGLNLLNQDGFRENNNYRKKDFTLLQNIKFSEKFSVQLLGIGIFLKAEIPSSLGISDYLESPKKAAFTWKMANGREDYKKVISGASHQYQVNNRLTWKGSVFYNLFSSEEIRPFNDLSENLANWGFRQKILGIAPKIEWTAGVEWLKEGYKWKTYDPTGEFVGLRTNDKEDRQYINIFGNFRYEISSTFSVFTGLNFNQTKYKFINYVQNELGNLDADIHFSPTAGLSVILIPNSLSGYVSFSRGFNPISFDNAVDEAGLLNTDLVPETGNSFDLGIKYDKEKFKVSADLYSLSIEDLIVRKRLTEELTISRNAGKTKHIGIEIQTSYAISKNLIISGALEWMDHRFIEFIDDGNDFSKNKLTGSPSLRLNSSISWHKGDWSCGLNQRYQDRLPISDDNTVWSEEYGLFDLRLGRSFALGRNMLNVDWMVSNLFDKNYASMFQINAIGFGGSEPRYYYPGLPRSFQVRLTYSRKR